MFETLDFWALSEMTTECYELSKFFVVCKRPGAGTLLIAKCLAPKDSSCITITPGVCLGAMLAAGIDSYIRFDCPLQGKSGRVVGRSGHVISVQVIFVFWFQERHFRKLPVIVGVASSVAISGEGLMTYGAWTIVIQLLVLFARKITSSTALEKTCIYMMN